MSIDKIPLFPTSQIPIILDLLNETCQSLKKDSATEKEDVLSDKLFRLLKRSKRLRSLPFVPMREHQLYLEEDEEIGHSGRIDINFIQPPGDETYFAIEAKRLYVNFPSGKKSLVNEYVTGDQGMMCFISGKYSNTQEAAAMIGYIFDNELNGTVKTLNCSIVKNSETLKLKEPKELLRSDTIKINNLFETNHELLGREFKLYHLLINV